MEPQYLRIRGARMHNLQNIDVDLPRNRLVVFSGLSGSGKSSLAFDTLYAEGQRRYVESLSTYARQFLGQMDKPEVDLLEGLSPAVSIEQRTTSRNPRSTVGTITEIYDHLRLLFARVGQAHCPHCGEAIQPQSLQDMVKTLLDYPAGSKLILLAPLIDDKKGEHQGVLQKLRRDGFVRARIDGEIVGLDQEINLAKTKKHTIEAVVDRLIIKEGVARRLADSVGTALRLAEGKLLAHFPDLAGGEQERLFSELAACISCGRSLPELSPQLFSFNNPKGACAECGGLGVKQVFDPDRVVADPQLSLNQGALLPWSGRSSGSYVRNLIKALAERYGFDPDRPFGRLPQAAKELIFNGSGDEAITFSYTRFRRRRTHSKPFEGLLSQLTRRYLETESAAVREELEQYMNEQPCPACHGARLRPEALAVMVGGYSIARLCALSIEELLAALPALEFAPARAPVAARIIKEIHDRLTFLHDVGLGYITLARRASTLSGGEAQRIRLASQIGARLAGVLYILDEPSIGLHQRDNRRLINTLLRLRDLGNTVIVVEHDEDTIRAADHVLDMGPGAGVHGGRVVYNGDVPGLLAAEQSLTGGYLAGRLAIAVPAKRRRPGKKSAWIKLSGAAANNLQNLEVALPLGLFTCVTGVSGSGKSSLVIETLFKAAARHLYGSRDTPGEYKKISGLEQIDKVIDIDQSPIGRTPRSNPATYTGVLTPARELFARLPEARTRGYKPGRFSFNLKGGRCEACEGDGVIKIAMHFLPDLYVTCEACNGKRYNEETLDIRYKDKNIAEVLAMTVEEGRDFFSAVPAIRNKLETLFEVGLGYLPLGQSSVTLSGGEAQRIKLSRELSKRQTGRTLYILDEPTTGLHPADIEHLLHVLNRLVDGGNTVVVIEHNLDVIKTADYLIDLGPEGGEGGGRVVAAGPPEKVAACPESHTGKYLKPLLG
ncbi:excinuclease ABC subunit UvrA [Desulfurivibrio dismutans]|uniref:excinuclease ABC subunit UvrA n=1 Tax=Desulfurivibrio dismutans TaxID=1398908 RepID=UPI0023DAC289|nr:excinuclease ABC subunit UvrA [Desulfurivibrio alkaliphilus]MDF1615720.1 excinuclease ABC subunit UvrA [Desulfurivibrio alkaliphilus]